VRLLVVEDDADLRGALAVLLREEGFAVDLAADGEEGLARARDGLYDAVVLDVMLPRLDGWQVLARLRPEHAVPVLMLTARDAVPDRVRGLDAGADDYLVKPFDGDELVSRLKALSRRAAGRASSRIEVAGLVLDLARRTVTRRGEEIPLTAREYALFEYLALHRGEVVSRTRLYDRLFDESEDSFSNLLDVHVSKLRRKLGAEAIGTRRGHGYIVE